MRHAVVGRVEDVALDREAELLGRSRESGVLAGAEQLGHVLHHKGGGAAFAQRAQVLAPQAAPLQPDAVPVEGGEALARRPADDDVHLRKVLDLLDRHRVHVVCAEVSGVGGGRVGVELDREHRPVAAAVEEAAGHAAAAREQVHQQISGSGSHDAIVRS